jgi:probable F420-dependent oxidoreductase
VSKIDLGSIGAVLSPGESGFVDTAVQLEQLGYQTIWLSGGQLRSLNQIADVVRATGRARVASGIISVDRFGADDVAAWYADLEAADRGRVVVGLGGAHGPNPLQTLTAYLDRLDSDSLPGTSRVLAALGPRMLDLARDRAAGAFPVLVTPAYATSARSRLGDDAALAVEQLVVLETDPERARAVAREQLGFLGRLPAYRASFRRMGFADEEIAQLGDRLVDSLVPWGDADAVAAAISRQLEAGADHVAISVTGDTSRAGPLGPWRELAERLIGG